MPRIKTTSGVKHFPYTKKGMEAAMKAKKMMMGSKKKR